MASQGQIDKIPQTAEVAKIIETAKLDWKCISLKKVMFVRVVKEVCFGRRIFNRDLPNAIKQRGEEWLGFKGGFKFADLLTAAHFCSGTEQQREYQMGILLYDNDGQLCCLHLCGGDGKCYLRVYEYNPDDDWDETVRFLVVAV